VARHLDKQGRSLLLVLGGLNGRIECVLRGLLLAPEPFALGIQLGLERGVFLPKLTIPLPDVIRFLQIPLRPGELITLGPDVIRPVEQDLGLADLVVVPPGPLRDS